MTPRAHSAKRSKPERMSVASAAGHIRAPWDTSSARTLGTPITPRSPKQPAGAEVIGPEAGLNHEAASSP
jgi:hypothetical protein